MSQKNNSNKSESSFAEDVWRATSLIPRGRVTTYGRLALFIGKSGAGRAVGNALNKNPYVGKVPCHRVIKSDGSLGGFALGLEEKIKMLTAEGVIVENDKIDLKKFLFLF